MDLGQLITFVIRNDRRQFPDLLRLDSEKSLDPLSEQCLRQHLSGMGCQTDEPTRHIPGLVGKLCIRERHLSASVRIRVRLTVVEHDATHGFAPFNSVAEQI